MNIPGRQFFVTNIGKKLMLNYCHPDGDHRFHPHKLVLCTSATTPTEFIETLDELTEVAPDCGFPAGGWPGQDADVTIDDESGEGWVHWTLYWTVGRTDGGDATWLVMVDQLNRVLGYVHVPGRFVAPENMAGKPAARQISARVFI